MTVANKFSSPHTYVYAGGVGIQFGGKGITPYRKYIGQCPPPQKKGGGEGGGKWLIIFCVLPVCTWCL